MDGDFVNGRIFAVGGERKGAQAQYGGTDQQRSMYQSHSLSPQGVEDSREI
jgi:hypothetical protein